MILKSHGIFSIVFFFLLIVKVSAQPDFSVYNAWDFENESLGEYTDDEIREDFDVFSMYSHNSVDIVNEIINGDTTKVLRVTHLANALHNGFDCEAKLGKGYNELYMSYNFKFSEEFNSTTGGKLPGFKGGPEVTALDCPGDNDGFVIKNLFKQAGRMITYHYDRTYPGACPWAYEKYDYDTIYFNNGQWYNITRRLVMNTFTNGVANADGIHEVWVDGRMIFKETGLKIMSKDDPSMKIDQIHIANWYGGNDDASMPRTECYGYIDNIKVWVNNSDPTYGTFKTHDSREILRTPDEITDKRVYNDKLITTSGTLQNAEYGKSYSPCIDEAYLIDAGEGNQVTYKASWTIGGGDYLFFYDGNRSDSKLIRVVEGYDNFTSQTIKSTGRYLFVRFSSNTDGGTNGFTGTVSFGATAVVPEIPQNRPPSIGDQNFTIKENEFTGNQVGTIIASDPDAGQFLTYSIIAGNESGIFTINSSTGELKATSNNLFDFNLSEYNLTIQVTDNGVSPQSSIGHIKITFIKFAKNIFIDPDNNGDLLENGSVEHPYDAWTDVIWKEGYSYFQKRGTTAVVSKITVGANYITLDAYGEGESPVIKSNAEEFVISGFDKHDVAVRNFKIQGPQAMADIYFLGGSVDNILIEYCRLEDSNNGIRIIDGHRFISRFNLISTKNEAIYSTAGLNEIYYNIIKNNELGLHFMGTSSKANIFNNVFYNNMDGINSGTTELTLYNNIFYLAESHQKAILLETSNINSDNNIYFPETDGFITINSKAYSSLFEVSRELNIDLHSYTNDPLFTNVSEEDFNVQDISPAINRGHNVNLATDFFGHPVPFAGMPDIGVAEYIGTFIKPSNFNPGILSASPNPSNGYVNIDISLPSEEPANNAQFGIINMQGQNVVSKRVTPGESNIHWSVDLSSYSNGIYIITFNVGRTVLLEKLILNK